MNTEQLSHLRHSLAHLLAQAVTTRYPGAKLTLGPAVDDGFYYDVDFSTTKVSPDDLATLTTMMRERLPHWKNFTHEEVSTEKAKEVFAGNEYKLELIEEIAARGEAITLYTCDGFTDLCRGGHTDDLSTLDPESFTLARIAGAYWRGDEKNTMLTRIYGYAFESAEKMKEYLAMREEAEKRDHRKIGEQLDLFYFDETIGKGLPIWLPKGNIIKEELENWAKETEQKWGYQRVTTPIITKEDLFYTSGHLPMYKDSMYAPIVIEDENYYIKPMNCPFHHRTFAARPKSYRELPVRFAEYGWCHRYEDSGSLFGLMRVRGMQMNDAHIYVQREKAVEEFVNVIKLHQYYYEVLGIKEYKMELALRDPANMTKYHGNEADWKEAEAMTIAAMEQSGVPYTIVNEGAAFYGPKMDFQIYSSIGRAFTASTNQLDLYMGNKFNLEYMDSDGQKKIPAIIHRAPLGTHERFIGFLIEHFAGAFPVWLSPVQVAVLPVGDNFLEYAKSIEATLREQNVRVQLMSEDSLGKRIRAAKTEKIPYVIVVGEKEQTSGTLTIEGRSNTKMENVTLADFVTKVTTEIKDRTCN